MQLTVSRVLPALQGVAELSPDVLFGNIEEVVLLSGSFLAALEACCRGDEAVGSVFVSFAPRLREVYAVYCRNHDAAVALIEKVSGLPQSVLLAPHTSSITLCAVSR